MQPSPLTSHPLTHLRACRGWAMRDVAVIVAGPGRVGPAARQKVWRWEHDGTTPSIRAQYALADAVGVTRETARAVGWPNWLLLADDGPTAHTELEWNSHNVGAVWSQVLPSVAMDRRGFLTISGKALAASAAAAIPEPITQGLQGAKVGRDAVAGLQARLEWLWHMDDEVGGGACLSGALGDLQMAHTILSRGGYSTQTGRALHSVTAALGRFAGWCAFDSGQQAAAQDLWHAALRSAHEAGDSNAAAYILSNLALQSSYVERGRSAVDQLEAARRMVTPAARGMHAMLDCWQTRAHAVRGEHKAAAATLNRADEHWAARNPADDPPFIYWMPLPSTTAEAGTAMLEGGDHGAARRILTAGLAGLPEDRHRDRVLYVLRGAELDLAEGDLDAACDTALQAARSAAKVNSHRVNERVDAMLARFPAGEPRTVRLREQVRAHTAGVS